MIAGKLCQSLALAPFFFDWNGTVRRSAIGNDFSFAPYGRGGWWMN
jgi:hypothetical protein